MSLKFVTRKLKTQKLEEQEQQQQLSDKIKHDQENVLPQSAIVSTNFIIFDREFEFCYFFSNVKTRQFLFLALCFGSIKEHIRK